MSRFIDTIILLFVLPFYILGFVFGFIGRPITIGWIKGYFYVELRYLFKQERENNDDN